MKSIYEIEAEKAREAGEMLRKENERLTTVEKAGSAAIIVLLTLIVMLIGAGTEMFG